MRFLFVTICLLQLCGLTALFGDDSNVVEVSSATANEHIQKKTEPDYPVMAKATRMQGTVVLKLTISPEGAVANVRIVSGPPLLTPPAVSAVKQWKYRPFIVEGRAATVNTIVEIPFPLGVSETDYKKEQQAAAAYFEQEDKCRGLFKKKQYSDAESSCRTAVQLVEELPTSRQNERRLAYSMLGHSLFFQKKFSEALDPYQKELKIAQGSLNPTDAELGYAYHDMALEMFATDDLQQAKLYYEQSVSTLEKARDHIESAFLKNEYSRIMKSGLQEYAALLRKIGDDSGAQAAAKRADAIVVKTGVEDN